MFVFERRVVASAIKCFFDLDATFTLVGVRHWDPIMCNAYMYVEESLGPRVNEEQGFVDQWGVFMSREEAMDVVRTSGQAFSFERNGSQDVELYSEGVW